MRKYNHPPFPCCRSSYYWIDPSGPNLSLMLSVPRASYPSCGSQDIRRTLKRPLTRSTASQALHVGTKQMKLARCGSLLLFWQCSDSWMRYLVISVLQEDSEQSCFSPPIYHIDLAKPVRSHANIIVIPCYGHRLHLMLLHPSSALCTSLQPYC